MLTDKINVAILKTVEVGLMQKWCKDVRSYAKKIHAHREHTKYIKKRLALQDLYPVFIIWVFGVSLSLLTFIGELLMDSLLCIRLPYEGYLE